MTKDEQQLLLAHARNLMIDSFASLLHTCQAGGVARNNKKLGQILEKIHATGIPYDHSRAPHPRPSVVDVASVQDHLPLFSAFAL